MSKKKESPAGKILSGIVARSVRKNPVPECPYCASRNVARVRDADQLTRHAARHIGREFDAFQCNDCKADWSVGRDE